MGGLWIGLHDGDGPTTRWWSTSHADFQRMLKTAGLPVRRFHDLRHTTASLLLYRGVHPRVVMDVLGHSEIRMTMDLYSHVYAAVQREAATEMNSVLRAAKASRT